jgi:predicted XRE-type DNA-binding protein
MRKRGAERKEPVTRGTGNVFADLGYSNPGERQAKLRLAYCVIASLDRRKLSDVAAAKVLGLSRASIRALRNYRLRAFSIEQLMTLVTAVGHDIEIVVQLTRRTRKSGRIHVAGAEVRSTVYERARRRAVARLREGLDLEWTPPVSRDELTR